MKNFAFALFLSGFVIFIQSVDAGYGRGREVRLERPEFSLAENQPEVNWISFVCRTFSGKAVHQVSVLLLNLLQLQCATC